jgi:hypothetical protein
MPLISRTFDQLIDFTRTTAATYTNSAGLVTLTPPSVNLLLYTQELDNAGWNKNAATVFPFNPTTATLGNEVVANGGFSSGASWSVPVAGASITGGALTFDGTTTISGGSITSNTPATPVVAGRWYAATYTIIGGLTNAVSLNAGGALGTPRTAAGTYTEYLFATTTTAPDISARGAPGVRTGSIDNVSIRDVVGGFITAPDGTMTGDIMFATAGTGITPRVNQAVTTTAGTVVVASLYVKPSTYTFMQIYVNNQGSDWCNFTLTGSGSVQNNGSATGAISYDSTTGWYRISMTYAANSADRSPQFIFAPSGTATRNQTGTYTGTESIFIWGAQFEVTPAANITLGPVINNNGVSLNGGATDNGNGTYTMPSLGSARFVFPLASLVNGAIYQISIPIISTTGSYVSDWCDENSVSSTQTGTLVYYCGRTTYDNTFRFVDITSGSGFTTVIGTATIQQVTGTTNMPSAYAKNVGGLFPARFDYDPVTLAPRGILIEEQRSNLVTYSEQFDNAAWTKGNVTVTANATVSPDGTTNADKLIEDTATSTHSTISPTIALTTGTAYTTTVYVKAAERSWIALQYDSGAFGTAPTAYFNIGAGTVGSAFNGATHSIRNAGNGWYRCSITATTTSSANSNARIYLATGDNAASYTGVVGNGAFVWGAQLEAGAFATSYIPTVASTVTRTADIANVTAANFSSWYNQPSGTIVTEFSSFATNNARIAAEISDVTSANRYTQVHTLGFSDRFLTFINGSAVVTTLDYPAVGLNTVGKWASAYAAGNYGASLNGAAALSATYGSLPPNISRLTIGNTAGGSFLCGHFRSIRYYPARLSNAQLQTLTA